MGSTVSCEVKDEGGTISRRKQWLSIFRKQNASAMTHEHLVRKQTHNQPSGCILAEFCRLQAARRCHIDPKHVPGFVEIHQRGLQPTEGIIYDHHTNEPKLFQVRNQ